MNNLEEALDFAKDGQEDRMQKIEDRISLLEKRLDLIALGLVALMGGSDEQL